MHSHKLPHYIELLSSLNTSMSCTHAWSDQQIMYWITYTVHCSHRVFIYTCSQRQGSILFTGEWSTKGCETNFNSTTTVCRCNHLTHFAILLSAQPLELPSPQALALQITGYIGVSVSLVTMAATICVFVFLKWVIVMVHANKVLLRIRKFHFNNFLLNYLYIIILLWPQTTSYDA